ncbi:thiosulfate reductase PhsA [Desulfitobacterium hafniense]|uniref:thiosulfate reductase PhsA n=1 Tax=Desulfitobacterium hafniense TaxID=49338 RepID=UPI0003752FE7|nr:thiosulfate reductase PhsA [Desulfitobacterium hafniense]
MKRREFLKYALYGAGGTAITVGSFGTLNKISPKTAMAAATTEETTVFSACEMCRNQCPIAVKVLNGKVTKIEGNPNDSTFGGVICARGNSGPSLLYDPQRLKKPMIRTGDRGTGKYKEVTWDEAYTYITEKVKEIQLNYGGEEIAFASRKGPHDVFFRTICKGIGSPNYFSHEATCPMTRSVALDSMFGVEMIAADYANAKYIITIGRNWMEGIHIAQTRGIMKALDKGAKLVVLDPRFSVAASKGEWLPIKGATDLAFVMAMANILIKEELYDKEFVEQHTVGFEQWQEAVKDKTPEWAEQETGIPKDTIIRVTREFAEACPNAHIEFGWRTGLTPNDYQLRRAIMIVNMMMGCFEVPGGYYRVKNAGVVNRFPSMTGYAKSLGGVSQPEFPKPITARIDGTGLKGVPGQIIPEGDGAVGQIIESILTERPYPIKGWFVHRFNPIISMPESDRIIDAFKKLDLLVVCDVYMTDTAMYADVILPECTYLERSEQIYDMSGLTPKYVIRQAAVPLVYPDTKPAWLIYKELGEKMGLGQYFTYETIDDYIQKQLAPTGITLEQLKEKGVWTPEGMKPFYLRKDPLASLEKVLATKSKKIELYSEVVQQATKQGIPQYTHYPQPVEGQFRFVQGKVAVHTNAGTANIPVLNELMSRNSLWIHPESAGKLGIADGDEIMISSGKYEHKGVAKVTQGIRPDTVFCYHGFGRISPEMKRAYGKGINGNKLIDNIIGEVGNVVTSMNFVTIKKA